MKKNNNERKIALQLINKIESDKSYGNILINNCFTNMALSGNSRRFITELVYGIIRRKNTLDFYIENVCDLKKQNKLLKNILRIGAYQIIYMDKIPDYAAVNETVNLAKKYGGRSLSGFVNIILRKLISNHEKILLPEKVNDPIKYYSLIYSHPEWLVKLFLEKFGEKKLKEICQANNLHAPLSIRVNSLKVSKEILFNTLTAKGIKFTQSIFNSEIFHLVLTGDISIAEMEEYNNGWFQIQDESSFLAGLAVGPEKNDLVIDLCAGPGGKITHLAALMNNKGKIFGSDIHKHKLELIKKNCLRLGVKTVELIHGDAREIFYKKFQSEADKVLADVPCSGLGVLRRRLDARWNKKLEDLKNFPQLQYEILETGYNCLRKGGILVYSTCTILDEENEEVVFRFLKNHNDMQIENLKIFFPSSIHEFITSLGVIKIFPSSLHNMDGFFIARMVKI